jgi:Flp pilus assembly protein TadD
VLGAVLYRAGNVPEAIRRLDEAVKLHRNGSHVLDGLFLAMAYHRQGKADLARIRLDKAAAAIDRMAKQAPNVRPIPWYDLPELQLLRREAETLLRSGKAGVATTRD